MSVAERQWAPDGRVRAILACPRCRARLDGTVDLRCTGCGHVFPRATGGPPDLRLPEPQTVTLEVTVGLPVPAPELVAVGPLRPNPAPEVDFAGIPAPRHLDRTLLSHFPAAAPGGRALDMGCGSGVHRAVCEHAGFDYVGLDYRNPAADFLGDAHALPFADRAFDFVLSVAVFEHLRLPARAAREVHRVLAPGGLFLGTVAFLEPFHGNSFFHHSPLGVWSTLADAGLAVEWIAPSRSWTVLRAQATNVLFPGVPGPLARLAVAPVEALHRLLWWSARRRHAALTESHRLRRTTGAFAFLARKPA